MRKVINKELDYIHEDETSYRKGGLDDVTAEFPEEVAYIKSKFPLAKEILLLYHCVVHEVCIYVDGKWSGYVSQVMEDTSK